MTRTWTTLLQDIAAVDEVRTQTTVSLNKEARIAEREQRQAERLQRENNRRVAIGLDPVESLDDIEIDDQPDVLLNQATHVIADLGVDRGHKKRGADRDECAGKLSVSSAILYRYPSTRPRAH